VLSIFMILLKVEELLLLLLETYVDCPYGEEDTVEWAEVARLSPTNSAPAQTQHSHPVSQECLLSF
jgi:hypothetical protein